MKSLFCLGCPGIKTSIRIYLFTIFIFTIILIGCAPAPTFIKSDFDQKQIKSIAIMPVIDKRNINEDTVQSQESLSNIEELLAKKIMTKNYDVLSPGSVKDIIKEKVIENMSPGNLCSELKVDGILYSELFDYTDQFFIHHSIKMGLKFLMQKAIVYGQMIWMIVTDHFCLQLVLLWAGQSVFLLIKKYLQKINYQQFLPV